MALRFMRACVSGRHGLLAPTCHSFCYLIPHPYRCSFPILLQMVITRLASQDGTSFFFLVFGFSFETESFASESIDLIFLLQVFCFLGFTSWISSSSSSSSSCLDRRLRLLWFRSARSRSRWDLVLGVALVLIYDENRMHGVFVFFFFIII